MEGTTPTLSNLNAVAERHRIQRMWESMYEAGQFIVVIPSRDGRMQVHSCGMSDNEITSVSGQLYMQGLEKTA